MGTFAWTDPDRDWLDIDEQILDVWNERKEMTTWVDQTMDFHAISWARMQAYTSDLRGGGWKISWQKNVYTRKYRLQLRGPDNILLVANFDKKPTEKCVHIQYAIAEHNQHRKPLKIIEESESLPKEQQISMLYERIIELQDHVPTIIKRQDNVVRLVDYLYDAEKLIERAYGKAIN